MERQLALINALRAMPHFNQAGVSRAPDMLGAAQLQYQADLDRYNSGQAKGSTGSNVLKGLTGGLSSGAMVGSVVPGIGTGIGALVGGGLGALGGLL